MRQKTLGILIVLVVVCVGAALFAYSQSAEDPRYRQVGKTVFPGLIDQVNDVSELFVESAYGKLSLHREGKTWRIRESDDHIASPNEVSKAIIGVAELAYFEPKTERAERYVRLQLEEPSAKQSKSKRIVLKIDGKTVADLIVGREKLFLPGRTVGGVYFRLPGTPLSWLGEGNPEAGGAAKDWLAREIADIDGKRVKRVTVRHPGGDIVTVTKPTPMVTNFALADIPQGMKLKYSSDADHIGAILEQLEMDDARRVTSVDVDWTGALVTELETFDGLRAVVETVTRQDVNWLRVRFQGATGDALQEAEALSSRTAGWVYMMPKYEIVPILRRMRDLLVPEGTNS
jgi:hypothetical protein